MMQDWCIQHNMIPDMQYGFYPGRSTLQPLFILRHIKHAAQRMQCGSSRLYAAFIDFKQAYDCIPRHKLWGHLRSCRIPDHILCVRSRLVTNKQTNKQSILKDLYHADEYTLLDGDKAASVQPSFGVKQGCPLSPQQFAIYLNDIDSIADGVKGALTGTPNFLVTHMLFADDLCLMSNNPNNMQTMLNKLRAYAHDMQLSSRCDDCWSSHILSAMDGLTQSYLFKERLLKCEPIDLGRFVVDLRERHLDYWTPYSDINPRECNSKHSTYHQ